MANDLRQESVDLQEDTLQWAKALAEIKKIVSTGWFILERPQGVVMDEITNLDEELMKNATSLRAFSNTAEVRIEREFGEAACERRIITTNQGEQLHYQVHSYLLAKTNAIKMINGGSGSSLLKCREYFRLDEDGMAWPAFERLTGVEINAAETEVK